MNFVRMAMAALVLLFAACDNIENPVDLTYSVAGIVTDAATSQPLEGATITIGGRSATSASSGVYAVANLSNAVLPLRAEKAGYVTKNETIDVNSLVTQKNISLQRQ